MGPMSIIVSVKIHDGIVLAADSATTFFNNEGRPGQIYEHANKIVNLLKGSPIGVMTCGSGGIGNASIATLLKDLRDRLAGKDTDHVDWRLDPQDYTMECVASRVHEFFADRAREANFKYFLFLRICGYSSGRPLPEIWDLTLDQGNYPEPTCPQPEEDIGPMWSGEQEALDRLIIGMPSALGGAAVTLGLIQEVQVPEIVPRLLPHLYEALILPAAPIQDAVDLARFMVETTKGFVRFATARPKTVGGPVEIAAITKHEGFRWIQRKHFYPHDLNVG
jgi:hypothetical protein